MKPQENARGCRPLTPELLILNHHLSNRVFDFSSERFGVLLFPLSRCCGASTAVAAKKFEPPQGQRPSGHRRRSNRKRQQKWRVFLCAARAVVLSRACNEVGHGRSPCAFSRRFCAVKSGAAGGGSFHDLRHPYVKSTTKIFSLRLMDFQAQAYPDARRKTRGACQLLRVGQSRSPVRPLCNRKQFSCSPPQSKMSWILYAISMRLSGYTSTRSISSSASSVVSASASKIALDAFFRLSCRACSSCFCFA